MEDSRVLRNNGNGSLSKRWTREVERLQAAFPQVTAFWDSREDFRELRLKARDDGTILAIAKAYGPDGTPMVAFGTGYDIVSCLMGLEGTLASSRWRVDKPYGS